MDPDVINLAKAIRKTESGGDFNAKGASGESGAYQWTPSTWKAHAKEALGDENAAMTPSNQNAVAYTVLKKRKDAGLNPAQIAAEWNSGSATGWENKRGTNKYGVQYDVPKYVKSVTDAYQQYKSGNPNPTISPNPSTVGGYDPTPFSGAGSPFALNLSGAPDTSQQPAPETPPSILPNLGEIGREVVTGLKGRASDASAGLSALSKGGTGFVSGPLQIAGAAAGALGDVVNAGIQLVPGVQGAEKLLGEGIKNIMATQTGQDVASAFSNFSQSHPEIAKDIGAGVNVLAAIPLLRGLGLVKAAVTDAGVSIFKNRVEKAAVTEIKDTLGTRASTALARAERRGLDPVGTLIKTPAYLPEVVPNPSGGFMYSSTRALENVAKDLGIDEAALQAKLNEAIKKNAMVSIEEARKKVLQDIRREFTLSGNFAPATRAVNEYFDSVAASSGGRNMISLNEFNGMKRDVRDAVFNVGGDIRGTATAEIKYAIGQSLMDQVETLAKKLGIEGVPDINKSMAKKIEAQKVLHAMNETRLKTKSGIGGELTRDVAGMGAEAIAHGFGLPGVAATFAGRGLAGKLAGRAPRTPLMKLSRYRSPRATLQKGLLNIAKGTAAQEVSTQATQ